MLINSDLLFSRFRLSAFKMHSFSHKQRLQVFVPALYALARFKTDHLIAISACLQSLLVRKTMHFKRGQTESTEQKIRIN